METIRIWNVFSTGVAKMMQLKGANYLSATAISEQIISLSLVAPILWNASPQCSQACSLLSCFQEPVGSYSCPPTLLWLRKELFQHAVDAFHCNGIIPTEGLEYVSLFIYFIISTIAFYSLTLFL